MKKTAGLRLPEVTTVDPEPEELYELPDDPPDEDPLDDEEPLEDDEPPELPEE